MTPSKKNTKQHAKRKVTEDDIEDKKAEKRKLTREIKTLQAEMKVLQEDEKRLEELATIEKQKVQKQDQATLNEREMFHMYGYDCKIDGNNFTFAFPTLEEDGSTSNYFIQISDVPNQRELLKYYLPAGINMDEMLEKFPLNINKNIPLLNHALRLLILCYQSRKKQLTELKAHLKNLKNCEFMYQNDDVTQISIRFYNIENKSNKQTFHFDLTVYYLPDERLPRKFAITSSSVTSDDFDDDTLMSLQVNFAKPFKNVELTQAMDNLVQADTSPFTWKSTTNNLDEDFESSLSEDDNSLNEFIVSLKNNSISKAAKKQKNKNEKKSEETTDRHEKTTKDRREKKRKKADTLDKRNEDGHRTQLTMNSFAFRKETFSNRLNATATEEKDTEKKMEKRPTIMQTKLQENPENKKKTVNQSLNETATEEPKTGKKSKKQQERKVEENQSENEPGTPAKSPAKQKKTKDQSPHKIQADEQEPVKKSEKHKRIQGEVQKNREKSKQPAGTLMNSLKKTKTLNLSPSKTVADVLISLKKSEKRKTTKDAAKKEEREETERPATTTVKISVQTKKSLDQRSSITSTGQEATAKDKTERKSKEAAIRDIKNRSWEKKKVTANQCPKRAISDKQESTQKGEKRKKAKETKVHDGDSENEEPAETSVKSSAKKRKKVANLSLNKMKKIDPKQTTLNFANKTEDAKKASKIPVMKNKPKIVSVQTFSSSTPLVSKSALHTRKSHFSDIINISEIVKND